MKNSKVILNIDLLSDPQVILNLTVLASWLEEIEHHFDIQQINISRADPPYLSEVYLELLIKLCNTYTDNVIIHTSLQGLSRILINDKVRLQVHLPFTDSDATFNKVAQNIKALSSNKVLTAFTYVDECADIDPDIIISKLNDLPIKSWELKTQVYQQTPTDKTEDLLSQYLSKSEQLNCAFINSYKLNHLQPIQNYFNTLFLYMYPDGALVHYFYNEEGHVIKGDYVDVMDLIKDLQVESKQTEAYCGDCPFKVYCLAESINPTLNPPICSGYKNLLK